MKLSLPLIHAAVLCCELAWVGAAQAATFPTQEAMKLKCFQLHGYLMSKPSVRNVDACWRTHGYLMQPETKGVPPKTKSVSVGKGKVI